MNKTKYIFNNMLSVSDYKDGKILTDISTMESCFINDEVFRIITPAMHSHVTFEDLYDSNYSHEEFESFIEDLIKNQIFITD